MTEYVAMPSSPSPGANGDFERVEREHRGFVASSLFSISVQPCEHPIKKVSGLAFREFEFFTLS